MLASGTSEVGIDIRLQVNRLSIRRTTLMDLPVLTGPHLGAQDIHTQGLGGPCLDV